MIRYSIAVFAFLIGLSTSAQAQVTKYNFSGVVTNVDAALTAFEPVGASYSGWFELNSSLPDSTPLFNHATYLGALVDGSVSLGSLTISVAGGTAQVQPPPNDNMFNTVAGSAFGLGGTVSVTGAPSWSGTGWDFQLASSAGAVGSRNLPSSAEITSLSPYDSKSFVVILNDGTYNHMLSASVDSVSVAAVPEPETYALLLVGLGLIGAVTRRRSGEASRRTSCKS